jgi:hypothetical protein
LPTCMTSSPAPNCSVLTQLRTGTQKFNSFVPLYTCNPVCW